MKCGRARIVLLHEFNHDLAPLPIRGAMVERSLAPAMQHGAKRDMLGDEKWAGAELPGMLACRDCDVRDEVSDLPDGVS